MNKGTKKILLTAGAAIAGFLAFSYIKTGSKLLSLSAEVVGFKIHKIDWSRLVFRFGVQVQNSSSSDVTINALNGSIQHSGSTLGSFDSSKSYVCKGNNALTTIKDIEVSVSAVKFINLITAMLGNKKQSFTVDGYLVADGNKIPFKTTKTL